MVKLIIDTDPGIDDAMAIFYAAADPEIELLGLTTIFGNVTVQQATRNALHLAEVAGLDIPVAEGAAVPLALPPFTPSWNVHGNEGFGDLAAPTPRGSALSEGAADFLIRMSKDHEGTLVLCPIGPLTNIAAAIQKDPGFAGRVARIVLMGGSLREGGNINAYAEANIYHDPHAADVVFGSGARIEMIGLDATHQIMCKPEDFAALGRAAPKLGGMLEEMSRFYLAFYESVGKHDGCSLHDPAAVVACVRPDLFGYEEHAISVALTGPEAGETRADPSSGRTPTHVAIRVDAEAIKTRWSSHVASLP